MLEKKVLQFPLPYQDLNLEDKVMATMGVFYKPRDLYDILSSAGIDVVKLPPDDRKKIQDVLYGENVFLSKNVFGRELFLLDETSRESLFKRVNIHSVRFEVRKNGGFHISEL
jgi:hypothetical protein